MKQALYLDCCIRGEQSRTRKLAEAFFNALPDNWSVTRLDLTREELRPLNGEYFAEREQLLRAGRTEDARFDRARQIAAADLVVIAAPFWDLSFPSLLKIYIENVSVEGITFRSSAQGLQGCCHAEKCVLLTTRGGVYLPGDPLEQATPYLGAIQKFFGFGSFTYVAADGLDIIGMDADAILTEACGRAAELAEGL